MKIQFKITNMSCEACAKINQRSLLAAQGVKSAKIDYNSALAIVEYDEKIISPVGIKEIITKNGYGVI